MGLSKIDLQTNIRNLSHFRQFVELESDRLNAHNRQIWDTFSNSIEVKIERGWYGNTTLADMEKGIKTYAEPQLLAEVQEGVKSEIPAEVRNAVPSRKMAYNARGLGVFSFDRTAMGLHKYKTETGKTALRTTNKKVFAYFPTQTKEKQAIEFLLMAGNSGGVSAKQMLYSAVAGIILAKMLLLSGYRIKISLLLGSVADSDFTGVVIPAKAWDEPFDENLLALLTSDARLFRYDGFKGLMAIYNHFGKKIPSTFGRMPSFSDAKRIADSYMKSQGMKHPILPIGMATTVQAAVSQVEETIADIKKINHD